MLLSSHILSEVEKLCDTVGIIRQGKIIETGPLDELRHLTRTSLLVKTKKPMTKIADVKGVHEVVESAEGISFQVDTEELDHVMQHIAPYGIVKLESAPPTLEDLFMRHYEGTERSEVHPDGEVTK